MATSESNTRVRLERGSSNLYAGVNLTILTISGHKKILNYKITVKTEINEEFELIGFTDPLKIIYFESYLSSRGSSASTANQAISFVKKSDGKVYAQILAPKQQLYGERTTNYQFIQL